MSQNPLSQALHLLQEEKVVVFPTETVYGLGANATDDQAVAQIYAVKNRPQFNPLIVHYPTIEAMEPDVILSPLARTLARHFWPGPLTLVLPWRSKGSRISDLVRAGGDTLAVRIPRHPLALELLNKCPFPLAAPSANRSGFLSPTTAAHVRDDLGDSIPLILEGGDCTVGLESTILDLSGETPLLLRAGSITESDLAPFMTDLFAEENKIREGSPHKILKAPGQLESHYAPCHPIRLEAITASPEEGFITFGPPPSHKASHVYHLSLRGNLIEAAAHFFKALHWLDEKKIERIAVMPIPYEGIGMAINDRLRRAAADRPS